MKKIIYSLVIMIAAGCLFTSCVENTVDQGRQDLLKAKASYLDALSNLRAADAEKVKAEAAVQTALAAYQNALAAQEQAIAEAKKIQNTVDEAEAKAAIDSIKAKAEKDAVKAAQELAKAQQDLDKALRKIAAESFGLTGDEQEAVRTAAQRYREAVTRDSSNREELRKAELDLWKAEFDYKAGFATDTAYADYYKKLIAWEEFKIKVQEGVIEAVKDTAESMEKLAPAIQALEDTLSVLDYAIKQAKADSALCHAVELHEADAVYKERVANFVEDSIKPFVVDFSFAAKGGKDRRYAVKSPGIGQDGNPYFDLFVDFARYAEPLNAFNGSTRGYVAFSAGENRGFVFAKDVTKNSMKKILVGVKDTLGLDGIVSALKRDMVVVADSATIKTAEVQKKVAEKAKADYDSIRTLIEAGLTNNYQPYVDSVAKTAAAKASFDSTKEEWKVAKDTAHVDSTRTLKGIKYLGTNYVNAAKAFLTAYNYVKTSTGSTLSTPDSLTFIAAAKNLGLAKAAYLGVEDTLYVWTAKDGSTVEAKAIPFSQLEYGGFVQKLGKHGVGHATTLYGGKGYGEFANKPLYSTQWDNSDYPVDENGVATVENDPFAKILNLAMGYKVVFDKSASPWTAYVNGREDFTESRVAGDFTNPGLRPAWNENSPIAYNTGYPADYDTVEWYRNLVQTYMHQIAAGDSKLTVLKPAYAKLGADKNVVDSLSAVKSTKKTAWDNAKKGEENAKSVYYDMAKRFYGKYSFDKNDSLVVKAGGKLNYSVETFTKPFNCVRFGLDSLFSKHPYITKDSTLTVIMDQISSKARFRILRNDTLTMFAKAFLEGQKYFVLASYKSMEEQLANIEEVVKEINVDYLAAVAKHELSNAVATAAVIKLVGEDADTTATLHHANIVNGAWKLGGLQKQWADELAPNYPKVWQKCKDVEKECGAKIEYVTNILRSFADVVEIYTGKDPKAVWDSLKETYNEAQAAIKASKEKINSCNRAIAQIEAGTDPVTVEINLLKADVEYWKAVVAEWEKVLAAVKAEYEAVMAKYITK